ncbi:MAG: DNA polymerase III subunit gamma/tau [Alphaproteobacteria bacterium]|nr:DNA polymerase III subunit gamma/tau [Alphaproteobacteria bacterium]
MAEETKAPYRVLARKYRPQHFDDLIGQDTLVRTLRNAIQGGRIAHAFMLTGIRGVGKTTTARIIAKALNYTGPDGKAGPTTGPTDDCAVCRAITEDRHPDVLEMDAASRTGVNDIREILDGVRYAPTSARYKIYIIDEVHMLSTSAFNALLKTLEEPPPHVKFIFATTEIRKVPVTVLSRCQRFDLRRVDSGSLKDHYRNICQKEGMEIEEEALSLIARAADGSVRDGLSLLDQAMTLSSGQVSAKQIEDMLGLADRSRVLRLLEMALSGEIAPALEAMDDMHKAGADPAVLMEDMLDYVHLLSRMKAAPKAGGARMNMDSETFEKCSVLAAELPMPVLGRAWQILLKGIGEIAGAPNPQAAAEMLVIRLAYASDLPDPADLIRKLQSGGGDHPAEARHQTPNNGSSGVHASRGGSAAMAMASQPAPVEFSAHTPPQTIEDIVAVLQAASEPVLASHVFLYVHPIRITPGRIEINVEPDAPDTLPSNLGRALGKALGERWMVSVSSAKPGEPTLAQREKTAYEAKIAEIAAQPLVKEIMALFPGAEIAKLIPKQKDSSS